MTLTGRFTEIPEGNLRAEWLDGRLQCPFIMDAEFNNTEGDDCSNGRYRQWVKGVFKSDGHVVPHLLCEGTNTYLSEDEFKEDGCSYPGCTCYGNRACPQRPKDSYLPHRATGGDYHGEDEPGIRGQAGERLEMDLSFRGELIDTSTGEILAFSEWTVRGEHRVPDNVTVVGHGKLSESRHVRVVAKHREGGWDLSVTMKHDPLVTGQKQIGLHARDKHGDALAASPLAGLVVTGRDRNYSASLRSRIEGKTAPAVVDIIIDGQPTRVSLNPGQP